MNDYKKAYELWLNKATDSNVQQSLRAMTSEEIKNAFSQDLSFGTAGLRGIMTAGTDRMNVYTVYRATEGLAQFMLKNKMKRCVVTYDSRLNNVRFGQTVAATLASCGIQTYLTKECMPTPFLSFAVRYLNCDMGVNITASHNPSDYNGYKVYDCFGCQLTDDAAMRVTEEIEAIDMFARPLPNFDDYIGKKVGYVSDDVEQAYVRAVLNETMGSANGLSVVYTPLNGAGHRIVPNALRQMGVGDLNVVSEQSYPDGNFTTCPYPNPEKAEALSLAIALARRLNSDVVIATDPDCDRIGIAVNGKGGFVQLTGNEVGVLLTDYVLSKLTERGKLPSNPVVVKTIVTTPMTDAVAREYGAEVENVLTGFKYIGDVINKLEQAGEQNRFVFGFEESCGYLKGSYVRDKDGVIASALIAECAAFYKRQGKTLCDRLRELYAKHGEYALRTISYRFDGVDGAEVKQKMLSNLRRNPFEQVANVKVEDTCDFLTQTVYDLPKADVMRFKCEDGSMLIIRPSGTEPLIKCYVSTAGSKQTNERRQAQIKQWLDSYFSR